MATLEKMMGIFGYSLAGVLGIDAIARLQTGDNLILDFAGLATLYVLKTVVQSEQKHSAEVERVNEEIRAQMTKQLISRSRQYFENIVSDNPLSYAGIIM